MVEYFSYDAVTLLIEELCTHLKTGRKDSCKRHMESVRLTVEHTLDRTKCKKIYP